MYIVYVSFSLGIVIVPAFSVYRRSKIIVGSLIFSFISGFALGLFGKSLKIQLYLNWLVQVLNIHDPYLDVITLQGCVVKSVMQITFWLFSDLNF